MSAAPSSFARRCASDPPIMVNLSEVWSLDSTSALSAMTEATMSALLASTTRGASPYVHLVSCNALGSGVEFIRDAPA